jgi:copper chaperone
MDSVMRVQFFEGAAIMYELEVTGMSCGHCASRVTKSVLAVDAAAKVDVDLTAQKVRVDSQVELASISSAITEAGYPVIASRIA